MSQSYDFGNLYGQADNSQVSYPKGVYDAVVESAEWGRSKDGSKGQWTIKVRTASGENAGKMPLTTTLTVTADNPRALGFMFRRLAALGVPVPDPQNPQQVVNGQAPFWIMGWDEDQVARHMTGRPVQVFIDQEEWEGVTRSKVKDFRPARPGAPTDWPRSQPPNQPPASFAQPQQPDYGQQQAPWGQPQGGQGGGYAPQPGPGYPQQAPQGYPPAQDGQYGAQPAQPPAPQPGYGQYQAPAPWQPPQAQQAPQQPVQGTPQWTPEQGGGAQPQPPAAPQPPWAQQPPAPPAPPQQPGQGPQQPPQAAPPAPPWAQQ